jgi:hypothetical protein
MLGHSVRAVVRGATWGDERSSKRKIRAAILFSRCETGTIAEQHYHRPSRIRQR